ncbi:hypothetical protein LUZ60_000939 [Juncus effusus]|nr:hypothetical protein LUZ60_000939 [Juncus effusus]
MLTCIACSKQLGGGSLHDPPDDYEFAGGPGGGGATTPSTRQAVKALTAQIRDMAVKASGAYRHCKPCTGSGTNTRYSESDPPGLSGSERFYHSYKRATSNLASANSTPRLMGGALLNGSSGDATPSMSGRTDSEAAVPSELMEEEEEAEGKEWVAQVEPGVLITFVALQRGGNDLKRIRFSREMFDKWQAQRWWAENYDKVMELYNVQRFNRTSSVPLPTPPDRSEEEDESSKDDGSPITPPLTKERLPRNIQTLNRPLTSSSSDSLDNHHQPYRPRRHDSNIQLASTPKLSSISGAKTDDASVRTTSSSREETETEELDVSVSDASEQEREWVEEDEPGVYITVRALPGGVRELRRVRFSRERFTEMHARLWWEENRARIHDQYL